MTSLWRFVLFLPFLAAGTAMGYGQEVAVLLSETDAAFLIDATITAPVSLRTAWDVLVDFDHMAAILSNLSLSRVTRRDGNTLVVQQQGLARYGVLSYAFESEREVRLEPMQRIVSRNLSGTAKRMESEARLSPGGDGRSTLIRYRATLVPDSALARMFGASFVRHEVEEQFQHMLAEMKRREGAPRAAAP